MYYEKCLKLGNFFYKNVKYESLDNKIKIGFFHSNPRQGVFSTKKFRYSFLLRASNKFKRVNKKAALLCSSALIGTYLYLSNQKQASCENDTNDSRKENMFDDDVPKLEEAVTESRDLIQRIKDEVGAPGIVVGVAVDGKMVWEEGLGFADVENRVLCSGNTVMRIASISKSITMAAVAKLWEEGKLDIDKPVQDYVPYFPQKTFNGEQVTITCRHLLSHLGGIRHYDKSILKNNADKGKIQKETKDNNNNRNLEVNKSTLSTKTDNKPEKTDEFDMKEYYIKEKYDNVKSSLDLFKDDPLVSKPGSKFLYSTHGWTLVSSIVEAVTKEQFHIYMTKLFKEFGMENTYLDVNDTIIYQRSRNYVKDKRGHIVNAPYVDNSYKWAGGGFLSTVGDLLKFGNAMLYSLQYRKLKTFQNETFFENEGSSTTDKAVDQTTKMLNNSNKQNNAISSGNIQEKSEECVKVDTLQEKQTLNGKGKIMFETLPGFLKSKTVEDMWCPVDNTELSWDKNGKYAMGWGVVSEKQQCKYCELQRFYISHTGGAIGASSVLLILPRRCHSNSSINCHWQSPPKGIIVVILTNLRGVALNKTALEIAKIFDNTSL